MFGRSLSKGKADDSQQLLKQFFEFFTYGGRGYGSAFEMNWKRATLWSMHCVYLDYLLVQLRISIFYSFFST